MEYVILKEKDHKQLSKEVGRYLERGYKLQGGVSVTFSDGFGKALVYAQALVREGESLGH